MTHLAHIGNSLGVRIPKAVLTQWGINEKTTLAFKVTEEGLLITPVRQSRKDWSTAFQAKQKRRKEPLLLGEEVINQFDQDEWEW